MHCGPDEPFAPQGQLSAIGARRLALVHGDPDCQSTGAHHPRSRVSHGASSPMNAAAAQVPAAVVNVRPTGRTGRRRRWRPERMPGEGSGVYPHRVVPSGNTATDLSRAKPRPDPVVGNCRNEFR